MDSFAPTITDTGFQVALTNAARNTEACLVDLRQCCATAETILKSPPPTLAELKASINAANLERGEFEAPMANERQSWPSISARLMDMQSELQANSDHRLPGQTVSCFLEIDARHMCVRG